jgi:hypothetical protein
MTDIKITREEWLNRAADIMFQTVLDESVIAPQPVPPVRVSVAPMSSKQLGVCYKREASDDQHNEVFITAHVSDSMTILATLVHELIHAADNCASGHRNYFAKVARKAGLEGKLTATRAGAELTENLTYIIEALGSIPHATLNLEPKGKGRNNNKITCKTCGFQANLSRKWASQICTAAACPVCIDVLTVELAQ